MIITVNKIDKDIEIPRKSYEGDAAFDVFATSLNVTKDYIEYGLGFSLTIPEGYKGVIVPRSSISNKDLMMCNSPAQIDSGYKGEIKVRFIPLFYLDIDDDSIESKTANIYYPGDRIAQIYFEKVEDVSILVKDLKGNKSIHVGKKKKRGSGGFGSSGA